MNRLSSIIPLDSKNTKTNFSLRPGASLNATHIRGLIEDLPLGFHIQVTASNQLSVTPPQADPPPTDISPLPPVVAALDELFQKIFKYLPTHPRAAKSKAGKPLIRWCLTSGISSATLQKIIEAEGDPVLFSSCGRLYLHVGL
jgi:hypothetical protein